MTRKRYIKLLMALGSPRNVANADAKGCQKQGLIYREAAVDLYRFLFYMKCAGLRVPANFQEVLPHE